MDLFKSFRKKPEVKKRGYLHLGSRIPIVDLNNVRDGSHSLVDPYFTSLGKSLKRLENDFPNFEFSPKTAHEFIDEKLANGVTYGIIRIDAPYVGIIGVSKDFPGLCKKMFKILRDGGQLIILTEFVPNKTGVGHSFGDNNDPVEIYAFLKGREFYELDMKETLELKSQVKEEKTVNIIKELKKVGFKVTFSETNDVNIISRSETAMKKKSKGKKMYQIVAVKD